MVPTAAVLRCRLERKDILGLRQALNAASPAELAAGFPRLKTLEKLAFFKLMKYETAVEVFRRLPFDERYSLLCGFPLQSLAPLLEDISSWQRALFHESHPALYARMLDEMRDRGAPKGGAEAPT